MLKVNSAVAKKKLLCYNIIEVMNVSPIKEEAINTINAMPEDANWDDIIYNLYVKQKITDAESAINQDKTISHNDLKERLLNKKWN